MKLPSIAEIDIRERKLLIRVDFDVAVSPSGEIEDSGKIILALPTIRYALGQKAKVIIASHMSGAGGRRNLKYSLEPMGRKLSELMDCEIYFPENSVGDVVRKISGDMMPGCVMLLENLEFHKGELADSADFAKKLSEVADVYVNEAFSISHQKRASTLLIADYFNTVCVGLRFREEIDNLGRFENPERPFAAAVGGRCSPEKIEFMESLMDRADTLLVGGALSNSFLKALGKEIGRSQIDESTIYSAKKLMSSALSRNIRLVIPEDLVAVHGDLNNEPSFYIISGGQIPNDSMSVDIGPETRLQIAKHISKARTVLWNGPMGMYERSGCGEGTAALAEAISSSDAWAGTGRSFISRGGEAALEFIKHKKLPAITALENRIR
jgi:phosphoglycerate kinase